MPNREMEKLRSIVKESELSKKLLRDKYFRLLFTSSLSIGWDLIYALFNIVLAVVYRSYWFFTMFVYYAVLGLMRVAVIRLNRKNKTKTIKACGMGMAFLAIVIAGVVCLSIAETRDTAYHVVVMISIAAYTFYLIVNSVIGAVKARRSNSKKIIALRNISLISMIGAVLSLERSMLGTFGDAADQFAVTMKAVTGAAAFIMIAAIGFLTIRSLDSIKFKSKAQKSIQS